MGLCSLCATCKHTLTSSVPLTPASSQLSRLCVCASEGNRLWVSWFCALSISQWACAVCAASSKHSKTHLAASSTDSSSSQPPCGVCGAQRHVSVWWGSRAWRREKGERDRTVCKHAQHSNCCFLSPWAARSPCRPARTPAAPASPVRCPGQVEWGCTCEGRGRERATAHVDEAPTHTHSTSRTTSHCCCVLCVHEYVHVCAAVLLWCGESNMRVCF